MQGGKPPSDPQPRKRGSAATRIPDDFALTEEMRKWAFQSGLAHLNLDLITEEFVDFWRGASKNATKKDWVATWRNRVRAVAQQQQPQLALAPKPQFERRGLAFTPVCPTCKAPPEHVHDPECPDQSWTPDQQEGDTGS